MIHGRHHDPNPEDPRGSALDEHLVRSSVFARLFNSPNTFDGSLRASERALELAELGASDLRPHDKAWLKFVHARAAYRAGGDRGASRTQAASAAAVLRDGPPAAKNRAEEVEAWLLTTRKARSGSR